MYFAIVEIYEYCTSSFTQEKDLLYLCEIQTASFSLKWQNCYLQLFLCSIFNACKGAEINLTELPELDNEDLWRLHAVSQLLFFLDF